MAFTMHSHSGQFCAHAVDQLEDVIRRAVALGFRTIGLTEHMPRTHAADLYPEELAGSGHDPAAALATLQSHFAAYLREAVRLRDAYADRITVLVGFESEWIRGAADDGARVQALAAHPAVDYFVGSLHHVGARGTPIDYDKGMYAEAMKLAAAALTPASVPQRNLQCVADYGGWLECNTAALRKGLAEPYPGRSIAAAWLQLGGKFTLGDDSHGVAHVATHYRQGLAYLASLGVTEVWTLGRRRRRREKEEEEKEEEGSGEAGDSELVEVSVPLAEFAASLRLEEDENKEMSTTVTTTATTTTTTTPIPTNIDRKEDIATIDAA
ncbi:mRNA decapping hydrolase [Niveomyces insectorum RCEF 264]|uniref:Histidinol-phosphatase n=1 Tax=Niveomyces insectorum RCEF 264 TaxID=1081102 RepID=A0A162IBP0_9HYPO|nr:mRNA decapping hydrolase [Niveomyces insectorum RCEF 264]